MFLGCPGCAALNQEVSMLRQEVTGLRREVSGLREEVSGLKQEVSGLKQHAGKLRQRVETLEANDQLLSVRESCIRLLSVREACIWILSVREACILLENFICHEVFGANARAELLSSFGLVHDSSIKNRDKLDSFLERKGLRLAVFSAVKEDGGNYAHRDRSELSKADLLSAMRNKHLNKQYQAKFIEMMEDYGIIKEDMVDLTISPEWTNDFP
jgi:hypothetical protein